MTDDSQNRSPLGASVGTPAPSVGEPRLDTGQLLGGRYEILSFLGRGGMGVVHRARDLELDEVVALKVLHRDLVGSDEMLSRFRREVKLARRVTHRNVARTFDIGEHQGVRFLTMELIEGESLAALLGATFQLEISRALEIARQMLEGMAAAHEAGVVHRDLKPENVCVERGGRVIIMDFGIARTSLGDDPRQTVGGMMGTPAYMAPEQVEGRADIDARADIYAFGAVLYEMLTGYVAWSGTSGYVVATARLTAPPPDPRDRRPDLDAAIAELVLRCMAREPADRFADARAVLRSLGQLHAPDASSPPTQQSSAPQHANPAITPGGAASFATPSERFPRRWGADGFREDIARQLVLMANASPSYRRLLEALDVLLSAASGAPLLVAFETAWQKRSFEGPFERPLLALAALRADARAEGPAHPLHAAIAAEEPNEHAATADALRAALARDRIGFWISLRTRRVQTNEPTRSLAWLWPATLAGAGEGKRPLLLFDVGASAGLNLAADGIDLRWKRASGSALEIATGFHVRTRTGFDPRPLDVRRTDDCEWLRACIWPEQRARMVRLDAAITAFGSVFPSPTVAAVRASSVPPRLEAAIKNHPGSLAIAYQTMVRGYIDDAERESYERGMRAWVAGGSPGERAWTTLELEEVGRPEICCALDVHVGTGGGVEVVRLGRTSYHPETVDVAPAAEDRLRTLLGGTA